MTFPIIPTIINRESRTKEITIVLKVEPPFLVLFINSVLTTAGSDGGQKCFF